MIEATGAQIIVKMLELQGIDVVAGIPGGSILPLYDELPVVLLSMFSYVRNRQEDFSRRELHVQQGILLFVLRRVVPVQ